MSWIENAEGFVDLVRARVRQQFPDVAASEPDPGFFIWRRGANVVQMLVNDSDGVVILNFIAEENPPPSQTFQYAIQSVSSIAASIIEWLDFRRNRPRGL